VLGLDGLYQKQVLAGPDTDSEEVEKRLKAALTAKREPSANSRIASPVIGTPSSTSEPSDKKTVVNEPLPVESINSTDTAGKGEASQPPEVRSMPSLVELFGLYVTRVHGSPSWLSTLKIYRRLPLEL
jgi:THO complex subunit 2